MNNAFYSYTMPGGSHWSLRVRRGLCLKLTDVDGNANLGMLMYNPENLLERYNAPDTLKCQHTFKLTLGHCLYSDMGRIFCSVIADDVGWHETVCGNSHAAMVAKQWGERDYQTDRNLWRQNGYDAFLVELAKYGLNGRDMAANVNWFSKVMTRQDGTMALVPDHSSAGNSVILRFEMDTLVVMHSCPHPLNQAAEYPRHAVQVQIYTADPVADDDMCKNYCPENQRGFANNHLYYLGK